MAAISFTAAYADLITFHGDPTNTDGSPDFSGLTSLIPPNPPDETPGPGTGFIFTGPFGGETSAAISDLPRTASPPLIAFLIETPEPSSLALLAAGLAVLRFQRRKSSPPAAASETAQAPTY